MKGNHLGAAVALMGIAAIGFCSADVDVNANGATYTVVTEGYDWGPGISSLVINFGKDVLASSISKDDFSVSVERRDPETGGYVQAMEWASMKPHDSKGTRTVTDAYLSDAKGKRIALPSGSYATIVMKIGPEEELSSPFNFDLTSFVNKYVTVNHTITLQGDVRASNGKDRLSGTLFPASAAGVQNRIADEFDTTGIGEYNDSVYGKITLHYASYAPVKDAKKNPLIIWLHGAGEGGTDPYIAILGNRVTALADEPVQKIFGGAYVLAPQTPIVWMNNGKKSYPDDGTTQYTKALKHLIDDYVQSNPDIDTKRIYVGGCSNGGYMTVNMILSYPDYFAAAYPVCEAYADRWISDAAIASIKNMPIWFTQARSDTTVKAAQGGYVLETYRRLIASGGKNIHLTYWDSVTDLSGSWFKADGSPYEYNGHWSWIYTLNNQCRNDYDGKPVTVNGKSVSIMEWLAAQSK